jgi:two-component system nitrate/nitrite response regulator NarL
VAKILIFSSNPQLTAESVHVLLSEHSVHRILNLSAPFQADALIIDADRLGAVSDMHPVFTHFKVPVLIIGKGLSEQQQVELMVNGAAGYCDAADVGALLLRAVNAILHSDIWIKRTLVPKVISALTCPTHVGHYKPLSPEDEKELLRMFDSLSTREIEVANMIRQGESNKSIAETMNITERTVKAHLSSIFRKFQVDDRLKLAIRLKEIDQLG